jgi:hypothetical protein
MFWTSLLAQIPRNSIIDHYPILQAHRRAPLLNGIVISQSVTSDIGMMGHYCPSRLLSRFPTAIDGIIMFISGFGLASDAFYSFLKTLFYLLLTWASKYLQVQNSLPIHRNGRGAPQDKSRINRIRWVDKKIQDKNIRTN